MEDDILEERLLKLKDLFYILIRICIEKNPNISPIFHRSYLAFNTIIFMIGVTWKISKDHYFDAESFYKSCKLLLEFNLNLTLSLTDNLQDTRPHDIPIVQKLRDKIERRIERLDAD